MSAHPRPPQRPRARAMLDASAQQKVGTAPVPKSSQQAAARPPSTASQASGAAMPRSTAGSTSSTSSRESTTRPRPSAAKPRAKRPDTTNPGSTTKQARRPIRIHSRREPLKWSFGGLTLSVRLLVSLAVAGILVVTLVPLGLQWLKQEQAYRSVVAEVATAEQNNQAMRDQLAEWDNEDFVAAQARERLGYVRPGETQFVVVDAPPLEEEESSTRTHNNLAGPEKPWMWNLVEGLRDADTPPASSNLPAAETTEGDQ